jgi:hypothetical protein
MRRRAACAAGSLALAALTAAAAQAGGSTYVSSTKGGRVSLVGDATASTLALRATDEPFSYLVEGLDGALIDGAAAVQLSGVTRGIAIELGEGNDRLLVTARGPAGVALDPVFPALTLSGGGGDDVVVLDHVALVGKLHVDLGAGADTAAAFVSTLGGAARLLGGEGSDIAYVGLASAVRSKLQVSQGAGDDRVVLDNTELRRTPSILLGPGDDALGLADFFAPLALKLDGGLGFDQLRVDGTAQPGARAKAVEDFLEVDNQVVYDLVEDEPGFESALDLANEFGVGLN